MTEANMVFTMKETGLEREEILNLQKELAELNRHVGTPEFKQAESRVIKMLPKGLHLYLGMKTNKCMIVDRNYMGLITAE